MANKTHDWEESNFEITSKRRKGFPSEKQVNRDARVVHGDALLQRMPLTAMIRNLGQMTAIGLIKRFSDAKAVVVGMTSDGFTLATWWASTQARRQSSRTSSATANQRGRERKLPPALPKQSFQN